MSSRFFNWFIDLNYKLVQLLFLRNGINNFKRNLIRKMTRLMIKLDETNEAKKDILLENDLCQKLNEKCIIFATS
jgi:hypothetical protein